MRKYLAIAAWVVAPFIAAAESQPCTPVSGRSVIVGGSSTLQLSADRVSLTVGVETFATVASEAFNANSLKAQGVIAALKAKGVADKEVQTSNLEITSQKAEGNRPAGFRAGNLVTVTREDPSKVGDLLQAAVAAGANQATGLRFFVAEPSRSQVKGLELAFSDARERATILARLSGKTLGEVVCVSDSPSWQLGVPVSGGVFGGSDSAVETGVQELHYAVYAVFELK
jgi:uncharacterized protein